MRGLTAYEKPAGKKRFFLRWRDAGQKIAKSFFTASERDKFARSLAKTREKIGKQAMSFNADEWVEWLRFKDIVGAVDPLTVAREWLAFRRGEAGGGTIVGDAISQYLDVCEGDEPEVVYRKKLMLGRWKRFAGAFPLRDVHASHVREWLKKLICREKIGPVTVGHHLERVSSFFRWCVRERLCERNPCEGVSAPRVVIREVSVLSISDARRLFSVNAGLPVATLMALEAFGGLRFSHAGRISFDEIDFARKGFVLAAEKHKSKRRGYLEGLPENLWMWLEKAPADTWKMGLKKYRYAKGAAFRRAGVVNPGNVLRHSFGSYYLALTDDAMKTAAKMQHTSPVMLYRHYKGVATQADAKAWFSITPGPQILQKSKC
jgi:integrase